MNNTKTLHENSTPSPNLFRSTNLKFYAHLRANPDGLYVILKEKEKQNCNKYNFQKTQILMICSINYDDVVVVVAPSPIFRFCPLLLMYSSRWWQVSSKLSKVSTASISSK
mmetsp:Transcript_31860/g.36227  ORF Transcript_31860/g.36227 Transcript_31860/m.36227 type:complete len:111 (-) Transcript_31860:750-1082(-)